MSFLLPRCLSVMSRCVIFNILLSVFICAAANLFFAWVEGARVSAPYIIAESTIRMSCKLVSTFSSVTLEDMSRCLANDVHPTVILL